MSSISISVSLFCLSINLLYGDSSMDYLLNLVHHLDFVPSIFCRYLSLHPPWDLPCLFIAEHDFHIVLSCPFLSGVFFNYIVGWTLSEKILIWVDV